MTIIIKFYTITTMKISLRKIKNIRKIISLSLLIVLVVFGFLVYTVHTNKYQQHVCIEKGTTLYDSSGQYQGVSVPAGENSYEGPIKDYCKTIFPDNYWLTLTKQPLVYPFMLEQ
jgi:hypothetical protein